MAPTATTPNLGPQTSSTPVKPYALHANGLSNGVNGIPVLNGDVATPNTSDTPQGASVLASTFLSSWKELKEYQSGLKKVTVDGHGLSIAGVTATARFGAAVQLDDSAETKARVQKSRDILDEKLEAQKSIYGVSTGFGGSADTRTNAHATLGFALLQHQQSGVISMSSPANVLPLNDPLSTTSMPEAWVRAAMVIRANSLIRGHSAVRWKVLESLTGLLEKNVTPVVPLRGSISASGDLSPLSYVAGTLIGNPAIRAYCGDATNGGRRILTARKALEEVGQEPLALAPKEQLGLLNGTAFSAAVGSLALSEASFLSMLSLVCTAMGTEALLGTRASFHPFIHEVCRPHRSQVEAARIMLRLLDGTKLAAEAEERELTTAEDKGELRQDRYALRTAPQFIGPQLDDIASAINVVTLECNTTTDNPLVDGESGHVHHGGNFQAMAVTNAMEKARLSMHHLGRILFAQATELLNPAFNRGLPPSAAATDPSVNYHCKGIDIQMAALVAELGFLANPVSTHIQSAEMHNQSINSMALVSGRYTISAIESLSILIAAYIYALCQALDLRALQMRFTSGFDSILAKHLFSIFGSHLNPALLNPLLPDLTLAMHQKLDATTTMDAAARMDAVAAVASAPLLEALSAQVDVSPQAYASIKTFRTEVAREGLALLEQLRRQFLSGEFGQAPASEFLGRTKAVYEFVRLNLGISMHGRENITGFADGLHETELTIGNSVTLIYESIRDGPMQDVVAGLISEL